MKLTKEQKIEAYKSKQRAKAVPKITKPKKTRPEPVYETKGWTPGPVVKAHARAKTIVPKAKEDAE